MSVRVGSLSRTAAMLIIAIGVITLFIVNIVAGLAIIVLGVFLYALRDRFNRRVARSLKEAEARPPS